MRPRKDLGSDPSRGCCTQDMSDFRTMVAKIQWVARESRPDVAGSASLLSVCLPSPTLSDASTGMKVSRYVRSTASRSFRIWPLDPSTLIFVTASDAGGPGTAKRGGCQGAWVVLCVESDLRRNMRGRVSMLS